jgi:UDP-2,4-diacetamido-2,4,6-trideoxy-beta-L-altropyranose hydrolase
MRCLTLADELKSKGCRVIFLCRDLPGHLNEVIAARGFEVRLVGIVMGSQSSVGDSAVWSPDQDAADCLDTLSGMVDWLVVDHYQLGRDWEQALRARASHILAIDDLADRQHDCDLLVDQNLLPPERYADLVPEACRLLLGPRYALLRPQFMEARQNMKRQVGQIHRILVSYGGGDAGGETLKALEAIALLENVVTSAGLSPGRSVDVVIGLGNPHRQAVETACNQLRGCQLYYQVEDMASLMKAADLALGAGGTTALERCCLGLPSLVTALTDNQVAPAQGLAEMGAHLYLGRAEELSAKDYAGCLATLLALPELRAHLGRQGAALVDGRGAQRVARQMLAPALQLRPARKEDGADLLAWRNHPDNRRHAFNPEPIALEDHLRWLARVLEDDDCLLLIAEEEGSPVGVLRYDLAGATATLSIYLVPGLAGKGYGSRLLLAGDAWLAAQRPEVKVIRAEVQPDNVASVGAFLAAGYRHERSLYVKNLQGYG